MTPVDAFTLLGIDPSSSPAAIKARYIELSKVHHPDKGGDPAAFAQLKQACVDATFWAEGRPCMECRGKRSISRTLPGTFLTSVVTCPGCRGTGKAFS